MNWFLRSMGDRDTHCGTYSIATRSVHAACGAEFQPLTLTNGAPIVLAPSPPDPDQICPQCKRGGALGAAIWTGHEGLAGWSDLWRTLSGSSSHTT